MDGSRHRGGAVCLPHQHHAHRTCASGGQGTHTDVRFGFARNLDGGNGKDNGTCGESGEPAARSGKLCTHRRFRRRHGLVLRCALHNAEKVGRTQGKRAQHRGGYRPYAGRNGSHKGSHGVLHGGRNDSRLRRGQRHRPEFAGSHGRRCQGVLRQCAALSHGAQRP